MREETRAKAEKMFATHGGNCSDHALRSYCSDEEIGELQQAGLIVRGPNINTWTWSTGGKERGPDDEKKGSPKL